MATIEKIVLSEKRKWFEFDLDLYFVNGKISNYYRKISLGDYDDKKSLLIDCII